MGITIFVLLMFAMAGYLVIRGLQALMNLFAGDDETSAPSSSTRYGSQASSVLMPGEMELIDDYMLECFKKYNAFHIGGGMYLRCRDPEYSSLASLDLYNEKRYVNSFNDYGRKHPDSYDDMLMKILDYVKKHPLPKKEPRPRAEAIKAAGEKKESQAEMYIKRIDAYNDAIPDIEISDGLNETTRLLGQLDALEKSEKKTGEKTRKLYQHYLPILDNILKQFTVLQKVADAPGFKESHDKLTHTIKLINEAMNKIIVSFTSTDIDNMSADMSTLESLLQQDGMTNEGDITMVSTYNDEEGTTLEQWLAKDTEKTEEMARQEEAQGASAEISNEVAALEELLSGDGLTENTSESLSQGGESDES